MIENKIISKLLKKSQNNIQLFSGWIGSFIGITLLIFCIQLFFEIQFISKNSDDSFGSKYIIINKKVSLINTWRNNTNSFSKKELNEIKSTPGVKKIGLFRSNRFQVWGSLSVNGRSTKMGSELFFESVNDSFVDVKTKKWRWKKNQKTVPLILPVDFINLYNFSFAPSRNLPPISRKTIQLAHFDLSLAGPNGRDNYKGQIVGFSDRINTVLVPESFLTSINEKLAGVTDEDALDGKKLIIQCEQGKTAQLLGLIKKNNWEVNQDKIADSQFISMVKILLLIITVFGILIIIVALTTTLLYLILNLEKSKEIIHTLLLIGVQKKAIVNFYLKRSILQYVLLGISTSVLLVTGKAILKNLANDYAIEISKGVNPWTFTALILVLLILTGLQYRKLRTIGN